MVRKSIDEKLLDSRPLVTIITVTHNLIEKKRDKLIKQCIESVKNQSYENVEHLVIDGASTDGTLELLKEYVESGAIHLYSAPDKGIYDAMNKGISIANGEYINFLNSDDFFHDVDGIATTVKCLLAQSADYSFADARVIKRSGRRVHWTGNVHKLLYGFHYCHQTMFVKTDLLRKLNGFDLKYKVSSDSDLMIRLYSSGYKHVYVPCCFVSYRIGGFSLHHRVQSRVDHSRSFYKHIGERVGLSAKECFLLWQQEFFYELSYEKQIELVSKIPAEFDSRNILREMLLRSTVQKRGKSTIDKKVGVFGALSLWKRKYRARKSHYYLFEKLKICKISNGGRQRKYYLFGFLPVLTVKVVN